MVEACVIENPATRYVRSVEVSVNTLDVVVRSEDCVHEHPNGARSDPASTPLRPHPVRDDCVWGGRGEVDVADHLVRWCHDRVGEGDAGVEGADAGVDKRVSVFLLVCRGGHPFAEVWLGGRERSSELLCQLRVESLEHANTTERVHVAEHSDIVPATAGRNQRVCARQALARLAYGTTGRRVVLSRRITAVEQSLGMETSIDILVPSAHPIVGEWFDLTPAAADGMPPHITLLWPWVPVITPEAVSRLRRATAEVRPFAIELSATGRFSGVLYLAPTPVAPLLALSRAIWHAFPETPPYGGELDHEAVPHLTAAKGDELDEAERALQERVLDPLQVLVDRICISAEGSAWDGRWAVVEEIHLSA